MLCSQEAFAEKVMVECKHVSGSGARAAEFPSVDAAARDFLKYMFSDELLYVFKAKSESTTSSTPSSGQKRGISRNLAAHDERSCGEVGSGATTSEEGANNVQREGENFDELSLEGKKNLCG